MLPKSMSCDAKVGHPVSQEGTREKKWSLNNASYSSSLLSDSHMIICVPGFVECVCCCSICNVQSNQLMCSQIRPMCNQIRRPMCKLIISQRGELKYMILGLRNLRMAISHEEHHSLGPHGKQLGPLKKSL